MRKMSIILLFVLVGVAGEVPVINSGGVVNAASLASQDQPGHMLSGGSIASIFGKNLATGVAQASEYPLPRSLNGTTVVVGGIEAPLLYVSPDQINFQVPRSIVGPKQPLYVVTSGGTSMPIELDIGRGVGIFTSNASGCGPGAILNVTPDLVVTTNSPTNSAAPGDYLVLYSTGLGGYSPDGEPAEFGEYYVDANGVSFGGIITNVSYSGPSAQYAGVGQTNVRIPDDVVDGCSVALTLVTKKSTPPSQTVTASIHRGRGKCVDAPIFAEGNITLERSIDTSNGQVSESVAGAFPSSYGRRLWPVVLQTTTQGPFNDGQGPYCPVPGESNLNAGTLTVASTNVEPTSAPMGVLYSAALPSGTLIPNSAVALSASGSREISGFSGRTILPPDITFTTAYPPGTHISQFSYQSIVVPFRWTNGRKGDVVTIRLVSHQQGYDEFYTVQAPAESGIAAIYADKVSQKPPVYIFDLPSGSVELIATLSPDPSAVPRISADGVGLGVAQGWRYTYRFPGLLLP